MTGEIIPILEFAQSLAQQTAQAGLQSAGAVADLLLDRIDASIGKTAGRSIVPPDYPWPGPIWG
jgi:hypothetical protein